MHCSKPVRGIHATRQGKADQQHVTARRMESVPRISAGRVVWESWVSGGDSEIILCETGVVAADSDHCWARMVEPFIARIYPLSGWFCVLQVMLRRIHERKVKP